jgi:hypothetical protein
MNKKSWSIPLAAKRDKIWRTMLDDATYRQWTSAFSESSYAVTDWKEGSKVLFLDGSGCGMVSRIAEHRPNEYLSIEHLGELKDGVEEAKDWAGARENYTLSGVDGDVTLTVEMDVAAEHEAMFDQLWPKALAKLKGLAEN